MGLLQSEQMRLEGARGGVWRMLVGQAWGSLVGHCNDLGFFSE